jgi:hypothetical protein
MLVKLIDHSRENKDSCGEDWRMEVLDPPNVRLQRRGPERNGDVTTSKLPTYFLSHGGGPWPYMTGGFRSNFDKLEQSLI